MKKYLVLVASVILATACTEPEMNIYEADRCDDIVFGASSYTFSTIAAEYDSYTIWVARTSAKGTASHPVNVTFSDPNVADAFTLPETIEFAEGESSFPLTVGVDISKLTRGKTENLEFNLDGETPLNAYKTCTLKVRADYTFVPYGMCGYYSAFLSYMYDDDVAYYQPIYVAEQDPTVYRLTDLYHNARISYSEAGHDLTFKWDGGREITFLDEVDAKGCIYIPSGWNHPNYGMVNLYTNTSSEYNYYDEEEEEFVLYYQPRVPYNGGWGSLTDWDNDYFWFEEIYE